jgi:hypothetical protein
MSYPQLTQSLFVPKTANGILDLHIKATQGGAQSITATASMALGTPGIPGTVIVMTANHVGMGVNQSMYNVGINTLVKVPLNVGQAGQVVGSFIVLGITHTITVDFFAWTPHTVTFTGLTSKYAPVATPTVVAMGSFALNAGPMASTIPASQTVVGTTGGGTVTLVSPSLVTIHGALAARRVASFTTLKLSFHGDTVSVHGTLVPEPATLLLLGAGALGLALVGRKR